MQQADSSSVAPRLLNLGCGQCSRPGWLNVDFIPSAPDVLGYDLRLGIPFADDTFDVVYHSHILEHFSKERAAFFLRECLRVLRPGGLLRVVVPDLENIARAYLAALDAAAAGDDPTAQERHAWMQVELLDMMTRCASGGNMLAWWKQRPVPQEEFIVQRLGEEACRGMQSSGLSPAAARDAPTPALEPVDAAFLHSGELRRWMYDRVSLTALLRKTGFTSVCRQHFDSSLQNDLPSYGLDSDTSGHVRKPGSLFMEGRKPAGASAPKLRVALFNTADSGGAGIAALRLHRALRGQGVNSSLYVLQQRYSNEGGHILPAHGLTAPRQFGTGAASPAAEAGGALLRRALSRYPRRPAGSEFFSMPVQACDLNAVPCLDDFDILHLHWVAGMLDPSLCADALTGRPVIWTLHDMNPFTGGCHYADGCEAFTRHCGRCPQLGSSVEDDLSRKTWGMRMAAYRRLNLHIVTPTRWLAGEAARSSLFSRFPIHVIPNGHPLDAYAPRNRAEVRAGLGFSPDALVLLFASQDLVNRRKGGAYLLELLRRLAQTPLKEKIVGLLLGANPVREFQETGIRMEAVGHVDGDARMAVLYNAADAVLVPSLEDNQPNVICEAQACGTPVVAFASGGIPEMLIHKETGFLAPTGNVDALLEGLAWADAARAIPMTRRLCRAHAKEQWHPDQCARRYRELYATLAQGCCRKNQGEYNPVHNMSTIQRLSP